MDKKWGRPAHAGRPVLNALQPLFHRQDVLPVGMRVMQLVHHLPGQAEMILVRQIEMVAFSFHGGGKPPAACRMHSASHSRRTQTLQKIKLLFDLEKICSFCNGFVRIVCYSDDSKLAVVSRSSEAEAFPLPDYETLFHKEEKTCLIPS